MRIVTKKLFPLAAMALVIELTACSMAPVPTAWDASYEPAYAPRADLPTLDTL